MPTRGLYGFRKNGVDKITYNHTDSYPKWLGENITNLCRSLTKQELNDIFDRLEMVNENGKPTENQLYIYRQWEHSDESASELNDWRDILRHAQGNMDALKSQRFMTDSVYYIKLSNDCNYAYIINLDNNTLEFWVGNQTAPQQGNRYGTNKSGDSSPCRIVLAFPLDRIPENAVEQMESCRNEKRVQTQRETAPAHDFQHIIAAERYNMRDDNMFFDVRIFHSPNKRENEYELYRNNELVAFGKCPKEYTTEKIFRYHVRGEAETSLLENEDEEDMEV